MTINRDARAATVTLIAAAIAGCTPEPIPELVAAAAPNPGTPPIISGETLAACDAVMNKREGVPYVDAATYSPGVTYKAASLIQKTYRSGAEHAQRLRAYRAERQSQGLFGGPAAFGIYCFYELRDGQLTYLASIQSDREDRISQDTYVYMVANIHRKMSGKNLIEVILNQ